MKTGVRAPLTLITASIVLFTAFIVGGGIYDLLDDPPTIIRVPWGFTSVHYMLNEQTLIESLMSMVLNVLVFAGLFLSYRGVQVIYDSKRATMMLIVGIALTLLGLSGSHYLIILKKLVRARL